MCQVTARHGTNGSGSPRICEAIRRALELEWVSQEDLAERLGVSQSMVARWCSVAEPAFDVVAQIEKELGYEKGKLFRAAGYVGADGPPSALKAIRNDPNLDARGRRTLLATYRAQLNGRS